MNKSNSMSKGSAWLKIVFIVVIVLIMATIIYLGIKNPSQPEENQKIYSYSGKITQIEPGKVSLLAEASKNAGLEKDLNVTALVSEETGLTRIEKPKVLPTDLKPGASSSIFTREDIVFSDLKIGDEVSVVSKINVKDKNQFEALKIEVTNVK